MNGRIGGGGRRIHGQPPPRNGRKDRDEDILLFHEMHKREKERTVSLLQPVSDEFEANGGNYSLYKINASAKKGSSGYEFLAESDKNDYDWLKTPPATPLFPSLEMEANAPELAVQREIPIIQPLSRFSGVSESSKAAAGNGTQKSLIPKSKARLRCLIPSDERPSVSLSETKSSKGPQPQNMNHKSKTTHFSASTDVNRRSSTVNYMSTATIKAMNQKESHVHFDFLTSNLSQKPATESSKTKPRSRGVSPLVRSIIPAQIPGFSDETPPNLRTDNRSSSTSRGRPSNPTALPINIRQKPETTVKPRRQSCSPSVTRGRKVEANFKQESDAISATMTNQRGRIQTQTGNGMQVLGSRMVEKVMNARKLGPEERELAKPKSRASTTNEGSGFGRIMSKSSLDMALKHMV